MIPESWWVRIAVLLGGIGTVWAGIWVKFNKARKLRVETDSEARESRADTEGSRIDNLIKICDRQDREIDRLINAVCSLESENGGQADAMKSQADRHRSDIAQLRAGHESALKAQADRHRADMDALSARHRADMEQLRADHRNCEEGQRQLRSELSSLRATIETKQS